MQNQPLDIAIVGCGAIADYLHAPAIALTPEVRLVALVDADTKRTDQLGVKLGVATRVCDLRELTADVEAVVIATPPHVRPQLVKQAVQRGLHVLCEKPFANTVAECEEMTAAADASDRILAVCHQFRFWPSYRRIRDLVISGEYGPIRGVEAAFGNVYSWNSATGYTVRRDQVSGGMLVNSGTHWLDALLFWFGDPLSWNYFDDALGGLESNVRMRLQFVDPRHQQEFTCRFRQTRTCGISNEFRILTDKATLIVTNNDPFRVKFKTNGNLRTEPVGDATHGYLQPASDLYRNFATAIRSGKQPEINGREGTRVLRLIEACYAAKRSRPIPTEAPIPGATW